jgi:hypothetical protein
MAEPTNILAARTGNASGSRWLGRVRVRLLLGAVPSLTMLVVFTPIGLYYSCRSSSAGVYAGSSSPPRRSTSPPPPRQWSAASRSSRWTAAT